MLWGVGGQHSFPTAARKDRAAPLELSITSAHFSAWKHVLIKRGFKWQAVQSFLVAVGKMCWPPALWSSTEIPF